jgi:polyhydroxybutyrate depolymerase
MKKHLSALFFLSLLLLSACKKDNDTTTTGDNTTIPYGKSRLTLTIDGDEREYYMHIPKAYTGKEAVPVVFMLHGTSGDGEKFYETSGWKEVGETENIITIFPSSWRYCIVDPVDGAKTTTKWNTPPDSEWTFCQGQKPRDDIKFLKTIVTELKQKYKVDAQRFYLVGFSNGGQMAAKCSIEMSDIFAAIVESAGSFFIDTTYTPKRKIPLTYQVGSDDWGPGNDGPDLPLSQFDTLLKRPDFKYYKIKQRHITHFGLNQKYTITGDTTTAVFAHFTSATNTPNNIFQFVMIKGLAHAYPNGTNHPLKAAEKDWEWLKKFSLP